MTYCKVYLDLDTTAELRHHDPGCLVNCEQLLYYPNGVVDCDEGKSFLEDIRGPHLDSTIQICSCYTEETSDQKSIMTLRIKVGLILLAISVSGYLLWEMCYKLTKGRSYIRYTSFIPFTLFIL